MHIEYCLLFLYRLVYQVTFSWISSFLDLKNCMHYVEWDKYILFRCLYYSFVNVSFLIKIDLCIHIR